MGNVGPLELAIVLIIALVIFGARRLPEIGRSLGNGLREFRSALAGEGDGVEGGSDGTQPVRLPRSS